MAKNSYTGLHTRPIYKQTMDDPVVVTAVDALLLLIKANTDADKPSWPFQLAAQTGLTITQIRHLLKLGRYSRRANELWSGFRLSNDSKRGYRVSDQFDEVNRTQMLGRTKACETILHNEVADAAVVSSLSDVERLFVQMAESRANELAAMRKLMEVTTPTPASV